MDQRVDATPPRRNAVWRRLAHPVPLVALGVLIVNDHALKAAAPGLLTGKLSDVAGLVFFPLFLAGVVELSLGTADRRAPAPGRLIAIATAATGLVFAVIKIWPPGTEMWALGMGAAQWPAQTITALTSGMSWPTPHPVIAVTDPTDLLALPALLVAWRVGGGLTRKPLHRMAPRVVQGSGRLALVALVVAGAATIADQPERGEFTTLKTTTDFALTASEPVGVQQFDVTVDASQVSGQVEVALRTGYLGSGVRTALSDGTGLRMSQDIGGNGAYLGWWCTEVRCAWRVTLFVERTDPTVAMRPVDLDLAVMPQTPKMKVPADSVSVVAVGAPLVQAAPATTRTEVSGEATVSPDVPIVEQTVVVHREAGPVEDPGRFLVRAFIGFEPTAGAAVYDAAAFAEGDNDNYRQHAGGSGPDEPLNSVGSCGSAEACDVTYTIRFRSTADSSGPVTIPWHLSMEMLDYAVAEPPPGRTIEIKRQASGNAVGPVTIRRSANGQYQVTDTQRRMAIPYVVSIGHDVAVDADGSPRRLLVTLVLTVRSADGPSSDGGSMRVRFGNAPYVGGSFDADGAPHTFYRYDIVTCKDACAPTYDFDAYPDHQNAKLPMDLEWTIEVRLNTWSPGALDPGDSFGLDILPIAAR